jgi:ABC-type transporter Mla MlaB component
LPGNRIKQPHADFSANAEIVACLQKLNSIESTDYEWPWNCHLSRRESFEGSNMTLKIEKYSDENCTTIRLIGRMRAEHLLELEKQIRECRSEVALDLEEVSLVDVEAVRFLGTCAAQGVTLLNCSPYITDWVSRERDSEQ